MIDRVYETWEATGEDVYQDRDGWLIFYGSADLEAADTVNVSQDARKLLDSGKLAISTSVDERRLVLETARQHVA